MSRSTLAVVLTSAAAVAAITVGFWANRRAAPPTTPRQLDLREKLASAVAVRARNNASTLWRSEPTGWIDLTAWRGDLAPLFTFTSSATQFAIPEDAITTLEFQPLSGEVETVDLLFRGSGYRLCVRYEGASYDRVGELRLPPEVDSKASGMKYSETYEFYELVKEFAINSPAARRHLERVRNSALLER